MNLSAYLSRIGLSETPRNDFEGLCTVVRAHCLSAPFENLDVQLKQPISIAPEESYEKIVVNGRGGWCYEQNGLLGWALGEIGFDVTRMAAGVMRDERGDDAIGNHLCLKVQLDRPFLADVGFGGGLTAPLLLETGEHIEAPFRVTLGDAGDDYWRFTEDAGDGPFSFDFRVAPADEALLARTCDRLQTDPASPFVQNLVVQQRLPDRHLTLRGRVFTDRSAAGAANHIIQSTDELVDCLKTTFMLDVPDVKSLWPAICARHDEVFAAKNANSR